MPLTYLTLPFTSERERRQVCNLAKRTGLIDHVRLNFRSERPLGRRWRQTKERPQCDPRCWSCAAGEVRGKCYTKGVVYRLTCTQCGSMYVGQTARTIKSRLKEHLSSSSSAFHQHVMEMHDVMPDECFKWRILRIERDFLTRTALEAIEIRKCNSLVNGCNGEVLLPFLAVA